MKQRIITAIIGIIIVLPIILYGSWPFVALTYLLATVALFELIRMFNIDKTYIYVGLCSVFLWALITNIQGFLPANFNVTTLTILTGFIVLLLTITVLSKNKFSFDDASRLFLATLFVALTFQYIITIRSSGLN